MKTLLRLTLLFILTFACGVSIAQNNDRAYKAFYKKINKGFPMPKKNASNTNLNNNTDCLDSLASSLEALETSIDELDKVISAPRTEQEDDRPEQRIISKPSVEKQEKPALPVTPPSDKPKPTARLSITNEKAPKKDVETPATVPAAKSRLTIIEPVSDKPENKPESNTVQKGTPALNTPKPVVETPKPIQQAAKITKPAVRVVNISEVIGNDIKKYNVVVATLSTKERANRLKAILFAETNEKVWIAKNDQNLYHFIIGSFDTEDEALNKRTRLIENYTTKYSEKELMSRYGILFTDIWILEKK